MGEYKRQEIMGEVLDQRIDALKQIHYETDPARNEETLAGKEAKSKLAIGLAGSIVLTTAGWAIRHQLGKAATIDQAQLREDFVYRFGDSEAYPNEQAYDSHEFESLGNKLFDGAEGKSRIIIAEILELMGFRLLFPNLIEALRALEFGETMPILTPASTQHHGASFSLLKSRLNALCHVAFRRGQGATEESALEKVAKAYGCSPQTIRSWKLRIKNATELGDLEWKLKMSRYSGTLIPEGIHDLDSLLAADPRWKHSNVPLYWMKYGNDSALKNDGEQYKFLQKLPKRKL